MLYMLMLYLILFWKIAGHNCLDKYVFFCSRMYLLYSSRVLLATPKENPRYELLLVNKTSGRNVFGKKCKSNCQRRKCKKLMKINKFSGENRFKIGLIYFYVCPVNIYFPIGIWILYVRSILIFYQRRGPLFLIFKFNAKKKSRQQLSHQ